MTIPASSIHFNGDDTAWLVIPLLLDVEMMVTEDRPCDTCGGEPDTRVLTATEWFDHCPDCDGTGRHTFTVEAGQCICNGDSPPADDCEGVRSLRVSIREEMVLGIYDPTAGCPGPASPHICWSATDRHVDSETNGCWLLVTNTLHDASPAIILPPDAQPGMWAVLLDIHDFPQNTKETDESS
jgi:hypothetical protein